MAYEPSGRGHDATIGFAFIVLLLLIGGLAVWYFAWEPPGPAIERKFLVNVNTAQAEVIELLPGIGPGLAEKIVAVRESGKPFEGLEDLIQRVEGIGPKKAATLQPLLLFEIPSPQSPVETPAKTPEKTDPPAASAP